jgi:hypothetical protein
MSMGQDMAKGQRTKIEFLNACRAQGEHVGTQARANERLVDIVKKIERATERPRAGGGRTLGGQVRLRAQPYLSGRARRQLL